MPMLVLAGSDDPVVPLAQAEAMVAAMQAAGAVVEHHVYEGEGHGFRRLVNVIDELERTTAFCERVVRNWRRRRADLVLPTCVGFVIVPPCESGKSSGSACR